MLARCSGTISFHSLGCIFTHVRRLLTPIPASCRTFLLKGQVMGHWGSSGPSQSTMYGSTTFSFCGCPAAASTSLILCVLSSCTAAIVLRYECSIVNPLMDRSVVDEALTNVTPKISVVGDLESTPSSWSTTLKPCGPPAYICHLAQLPGQQKNKNQKLELAWWARSVEIGVTG